MLCVDPPQKPFYEQFLRWMARTPTREQQYQFGPPLKKRNARRMRRVLSCESCVQCRCFWKYWEVKSRLLHLKNCTRGVFLFHYKNWQVQKRSDLDWDRQKEFLKGSVKHLVTRRFKYRKNTKHRLPKYRKIPSRKYKIPARTIGLKYRRNQDNLTSRTEPP